jgi:hypothetical protein
MNKLRTEWFGAGADFAGRTEFAEAVFDEDNPLNILNLCYEMLKRADLPDEQSGLPDLILENIYAIECGVCDGTGQGPAPYSAFDGGDIYDEGETECWMCNGTGVRK